MTLLFEIGWWQKNIYAWNWWKYIRKLFYKIVRRKPHHGWMQLHALGFIEWMVARRFGRGSGPLHFAETSLCQTSCAQSETYHDNNFGQTVNKTTAQNDNLDNDTNNCARKADRTTVITSLRPLWMDFIIDLSHSCGTY